MDARIAVPKAAIHHGPEGYSDLPSKALHDIFAFGLLG